MRHHQSKAALGFAFVGTLLLSSAASLAPPPVQAQAGSYTFSETGKTVRGKFLDYWAHHGGTRQQGLPISEEMQERSATDGKVYTVQYFENAVLELHPENPAPAAVLLSLLGVFLYQQRYPNGATGQQANTTASAVYFPATGKHAGCTFLEYWRTHGGLEQFGYPMSEEFDEISEFDGRSYRVQYFQRAVLEYHMEAVRLYEREPPATLLVRPIGTVRLQALGSAPLPGGVALPIPAGRKVCTPTPQGPSESDQIEDAPLRSSVGTGHLLRGVVRSARNCTPIAGATLIFWLAGSDGQYDDAHRAKVRTDQAGAYTFVSNYPAFYGAGGPHIHLYITADGYGGVETELFPACNQTQGVFDPVLRPRVAEAK